MADEAAKTPVNPEVLISSVIMDIMGRSAKSKASLSDRLWAKLLSRFPVVSTDMAGIDDCPTMCTDGVRIYYNPEFISDICAYAVQKGKNPNSWIKFLLAHEIMHIIYKNVGDRRERTFDIPGPCDRAYKELLDISNKAADSIINARLKREFKDVPEGYTKRSNGEQKRFYFYRGETEKAWTQVFVEACNEASRKMAEKLRTDIDEYPDDFYGAIRLFRTLFPKIDGRAGQGSGGGSKDVEEAVDEFLGGNAMTDSHEKNEAMMKDKNKALQSKADRAMNELKREIEQEKKTAGPGAVSSSLLVSLCEKYFRPKPEPWYVGISLLLKSKVSEGRQVRERIPPLEMLTQVMSGNSVIQFEKSGKKLNIVFAVDVSGSMSDMEVLSGTLKILEFLERNIPKGSQGHKFVFCQVDAGIEEWKEMIVPSREYLSWKKEIASKGFRRCGIGGTEFAPFFKKISEMKQKPDAVVVFSDLELYDYPETEKIVRKFKNSVIWLCSGRSVPDSFYKYDLGRVYETASLFDAPEIRR